jgi:uncharacterized protein (TIGR00369 family)
MVPGMMSAPMPTRREVIAQFIPASPLVRHLGIRVQALEHDRAELVLPYEPNLATMDDVVHGGAIASLIDTAGMAAAWADDEVPEALAGATVSMTVDYVASARGADLIAIATVARRGRSLCFTDVRVTEPDGRLVAKGSLVYRLGG